MGCPFIYVNGVLNLLINGKTFQIRPDHPSYGLIKKSLATATADELTKLVDAPQGIQSYVATANCNRVGVKEGLVYFDGKPVHNTLATRIVEFMREGLPFKHLTKFMENLASNPSMRAVEELYDFLEHKNLPITEDGCFLGYKAVSNDWTDKYTGTVDNHIGRVISMPRNKVDDDCRNECSYGFHVGALEYIRTFGGSNDRLLIVKVNPADVVAVPADYQFTKLRTCKYEVVSEYEGDLSRPLYTSNAKAVDSAMADDKYDWGWADEGYDDEDDEDDDYNDDEDYYHEWENIAWPRTL